MALTHHHHLLLHLAIVILCTSYPAVCDAQNEVEILLQLKASLTNAEVSLKDWNATSTPPCIGSKPQWIGLICSDNGNVWGLRFERMNLSGSISIDILSQFPSLRALSFQYNSFKGEFPEFNKLTALKQLYLSSNQFTGDIPDDAFVGMVWLNTLNLSSNGFTGTIPSSLPKACPRLVQVRLDGNQFQGQIPDFPQQPPPMVNVANNHLEGSIPPSLSKQDNSLFSGNNLCGAPLTPCHGAKKNKSKKMAAEIKNHVLGLIISIFVVFIYI